MSQEIHLIKVIATLQQAAYTQQIAISINNGNVANYLAIGLLN